MTLRASTALLLALLALASAASTAVPAVTYPQPPQVLFKGLFAAVEAAAIYPDSKAFADAIPRTQPARILAEYHARQPRSAAALKQFTAEYFSVPSASGVGTLLQPHEPIVAHIDRLWPLLTRSTPTAPRYSSLLPLPQPYVVPGGRFRELYYWDSYFTMLGLDQSGRHDLVADMVQDFAYLIDTYGHVPNGTRTYYLSRSQPPLFFEMVGLQTADPAGAFAHYLPELKREYAFWMRGARGLRRGSAQRRVVRMPDGSILNRYWDDRDTPRDESYRQDLQLAQASTRPAARMFREIRATAESGWDFSSRWFADERTAATLDTTEIVPVDLNSLLFGLESAIRLGCQRQADAACAQDFAKRAAARHAAIDRYLWDASRGWYVDYRWTQRTSVMRLSAATLYPLFVALASRPQAQAVAMAVSRDLLRPGGVVTTLRDTGQQWDAPNGWAPLQWIAVAGLRRYGQDAVAEAIACRWMVNVEQVYSRSAKLVEKYNVSQAGLGGGGGEYPLQDGFGWTNGVMRKLIALYPVEASYSALSQCPVR